VISQPPSVATALYVKFIFYGIKSFVFVCHQTTSVKNNQPSDAVIREQSDAVISEPSDAVISQPSGAVFSQPSDAVINWNCTNQCNKYHHSA